MEVKKITPCICCDTATFCRQIGVKALWSIGAHKVIFVAHCEEHNGEHMRVCEIIAELCGVSRVFSCLVISIWKGNYSFWVAAILRLLPFIWKCEQWRGVCFCSNVRSTISNLRKVMVYCFYFEGSLYILSLQAFYYNFFL